MKRYYALALAIFSIFVCASSALAKKPAQAEAFSCANYALTPPSLIDVVAPSVTLIVDSSGSMNEHAYQETRIIWKYSGESEQRRGYTGFNSTKEYYGYFDPYSYYSYNSTGNNFYVDASGGWSGNFMNWVSMHRTDVVRKVLTGGPYDSTAGTYKISRTDEGNYRGKYHTYDDTNPVIDLNGKLKHMLPSGYEGKFGFVQTSSSDNLFIYNVSSVNPGTPDEWVIGLKKSEVTLKVASEKKYGMLDRFGYRMRLSLFRYDDDSSMANGGKMLSEMTSDPSDISSIINSINTLSMDSWTPLAETFYTVCGYVMQSDTDNNGPMYEGDSYLIGKLYDPFYFADLKKNLWCTQQNVILITDGESTQDKSIPSTLTSSADDVGNNDGLTYESDGSGYLDNVAYWAHTTDLRNDLGGKQTINLYTIFAFGSGSQLLQDAAKWGGFIDRNNNGLPEESEYDANDDGIPDNYFEAASGAELENALVISFSSILNRVSSGTAASVVSTSREGTGFLCQAVYWPELQDTKGNEITWAGDIYAYWLDDQGRMYEDDGSTPGFLDAADSNITVWYDVSATPKRSRACSGGTMINGECVNGTVKELGSVKHFWSAAKWLNQSSLNATVQRSAYLDDGEGKTRRYIKTWDDDGDGKVEATEFKAFSTDKFSSNFFNATVTNWLRGQDAPGLRSRNIFVDTDSNGSPDSYVTWRLGDIINSSPTVVAQPTENFDLVWDDPTYTDFYTKYRDRRVMIYYGANDGMLHAVNGGFYVEDENTYCKSRLSNGTCDNNNGFDLGTEMWAYVPRNLHHHLACLAGEKYEHQYYVDLKPRVFEVQIFENDETHPNGWGTILVTGFNFGGDGQQDLVHNSQYFGSSFFIFDITDPEVEPEFLGEFTYDGEFTLGYALNQPTVVAVKDTGGTKYWYMLFGTGPLTSAGSSTQKAQVVVMPLSELVNSSNKANSTFPLRLKNDKDKPTMTAMGVIPLPDSRSAMGTGFASVDYDFDFFVDMMYYGTVVTPNSGQMTGGVHRLKIEAEPDPSKWEPKEMTNTGGPMTGGINVGFKDKNVWVYFGTGKFWDTADKTDLRAQWLYGIMEPKKTGSSAYNFSQIPAGNLIDVTDFYVRPDGSGDLFCKSTNSTGCLPSGVITVDDLEKYIRETASIDGWKRQMTDPGERVLGEPSLFGGLVNFITSVPSNDPCTAEGYSKLYALYYLTGTAWKENVFGDAAQDYIPFIVDLGQGLSVRPSLHLGKEEGVRLYIQTTTGSIIEIHQPNLPLSNVRSGKGGWHTLQVD